MRKVFIDDQRRQALESFPVNSPLHDDNESSNNFNDRGRGGDRSSRSFSEESFREMRKRDDEERLRNGGGDDSIQFMELRDSECIPDQLSVTKLIEAKVAEQDDDGSDDGSFNL